MTVMRLLWIGLILMTAVPAFSQNWARASYSTNGKMVEIVDLTGLQSCKISNVSGKVTKIKVSDSSAAITLKREDERLDFRIPLSAVKPEDRGPLFDHLVTKGNTLEIAGYRCTDGEPPSAFSIRRVY